MFVRASITTMAFLLTWSALARQPDETARRDGPRELKVAGLRGEHSGGEVDKPTVIAGTGELEKAFPDQGVRDQLAKQVDFDKQQLLLFAWSGSGGDRLGFRLEEGERGPVVVFLYRGGLTRDYRPHIHVFAVPKEATWRIEHKGPGR